MVDQSPSDLVRRTMTYCRVLRRHGLPVTTPRLIDAVRALEHLDFTDATEVRFGLRTILASRHDDLAVFDRMFDLFWLGRGEPRVATDRVRPAGGPPDAPRRSKTSKPAGELSIEAWADEGQETTGDPIGTPAMSDRESTMGQDFSSFSDDQLEDLLRVAMALARRLAGRLRRRWRGGAPGKIDFRRTVRANLARDEWIELRRRRRRRRPLRLVILCDVSGSMNLYSRVLLLFIYALQQAFARVEAFAFSTRLTRITGYLRGRSYKEALGRLAAVSDWSGGTRIGESLEAFTRQFGSLLDRQTLVIVLSDGWDTGEPELLVHQLAHIRKRARALVWLNPLLGHAGYQPLTRGMAAALPHLDRFAPAHNLRSLQEFAESV